MTYTPTIFNAANAQDKQSLLDLLDDTDVEIIDTIDESIEDLFKIDFPFVAPGSPEYVKTLAEYTARYMGNKEKVEVGVWVYIPWKQTLVHLPHEDDFFKMRTARNKFLIEPDEQDKFYNAHIGIAGLSVGSSALNSLVLSGGAKYLRLADNDTLAITNLNRLQDSICNLTKKKAENAARRIYEINPFQQIKLYSDGLSAELMDEFFTQPEKLTVFIEEMDDIKLKIDSRFKARELGIPVVMATDNGDNAIIDVERFDLEPDRPLFHGSISEEVLRNVPAHPNGAQRVQLASVIVGSKITPRTQRSLTMVGTKLPSWPQLGNAATLSGVAVSYIVRRILTGAEMPSGRYEVNLDACLDVTYDTEDEVQARADQTHKFETALKLLFGV